MTDTDDLLRIDPQPWMTYQDSSGAVVYVGVPMGAAPVSQPLGPGVVVAESPWQPVLVVAGLAGVAAVAVTRRRRRGLGAA